MRLTVNKPVEIDVSAIRVVVPVRYGEEDIPNDFPFRVGDVWDVTVNIDSGEIQGWVSKGHPAAQCYMKVVDQGRYYLLDYDEIEVKRIEQDYVPSCIPGEYGDYIEFNIGADGVVQDWHHYCTAKKIKEEFFADE
jgi:hypothetical protein